ncbi:MAG: hypothetical protein JSR60_04145 [Proteobacteria bacterium]|nr:hypothetical protein [Pseudomonadota bacterium]
MPKTKAAPRSASTGRFILGRQAFGKISAVEGLRMSKTMRDDFHALDKQGASAKVRRDTLSGKYGK